MIVEYLRYTIAESQQADFIKSYHKAAGFLLESTYCLSYECCQCEEDRSQFIVRIEWTSPEDHLQKFRKSAEFRKFFSHIKAYIDDIDEMRHYRQLELRPG